MAIRAPTSFAGVVALCLIGTGLFVLFCLVVAAMLAYTAQLAFADWLAIRPH